MILSVPLCARALFLAQSEYLIYPVEANLLFVLFTLTADRITYCACVLCSLFDQNSKNVAQFWNKYIKV